MNRQKEIDEIQASLRMAEEALRRHEPDALAGRMTWPERSPRKQEAASVPPTDRVSETAK